MARCQHKSLLKKEGEYICIECMEKVYLNPPPTLAPISFESGDGVTTLTIHDTEDGEVSTWVVKGNNPYHPLFDQAIIEKCGHWDIDIPCGENGLLCHECEEDPDIDPDDDEKEEPCGEWFSAEFSAVANHYSGQALRNKMSDHWDYLYVWTEYHPVVK